jgi:CubicO group peptidase (beta-lactamase class C family)
LTFGFLVGEVVRRVTGRSVGAFVREEIADPLGLDLWIGAPSEVHHRIAHSTYYVPTEEDFAGPMGALMQIVLTQPQSLPGTLQLNDAGWIGVQEPLNTAASFSAEIPAANGVASARALANLYTPLSLDGSFDGVRLLRPETLSSLRYVQARSAVDAAVPIIGTAWSLGYMKAWDNRHIGTGASVIWGEDAFGHAGLGGSVGFADPSVRLSFGYVMNEHGLGTGINPRGQSLVDATYRALKSPTDSPGYWVRPAS